MEAVPSTASQGESVPSHGSGSGKVEGSGEDNDDAGVVEVVIPASGIGQRSGQAIPKQYVEIDGRPIVGHTICNFHKVPLVTRIVVTVAPEWRAFLQKWVDDQQCLHKVVVAVGDRTCRHLSIEKGLQALERGNLQNSQERIVVVHDAARPFLSEAVLAEVVRKARSHGAAGVVVPCTSTILQVSNDGLMECGLVRSNCRCSEMPQAFRFHQLLHAYEKASADEKVNGTECLAIYQKYNPDCRVATVEADPDLHWKVTYPRDFERAQLLLKELASS